MDVKLNIGLLKKSIKHWEENAQCEDYRDMDISGEACALCVAFNPVMTEYTQSCSNCCIGHKTGQKFCRGTVYDTIEGQDDSGNGIQMWAVEEMLQFLKNLLVELEGK